MDNVLESNGFVSIDLKCGNSVKVSNEAFGAVAGMHGRDAITGYSTFGDGD